MERSSLSSPKPRLRGFSLLSLAGLVLAASCFQGAKSPQVSPTRSLELPGEGNTQGSDKPFAVVFASPRGKAVDPSEVTIVFNRPMRPLTLAGDEAAPPASLVASGLPGPVAGEWRWMGTSALIFAPNPHLPRATEYVVKVPAGTRALDGSALAKEYAFSFSTPRPELVRLEPDVGEQHALPMQPFELRFNQPVDPREVERAVKVRLPGDRIVGLKATWPDPQTKTFVKASPVSPLPLATTFDLEVDATLRGLEGPLPTGTVKQHSMQTYGPLAIKAVDCSRETQGGPCLPDGRPHLELSNRVSFQDLRAHVRVEPGTKLDWGHAREGDDKVQWIPLPLRLRPAQSYRVTVTAGLVDEYGQRLTRDVTFPLTVGDYRPSAELGVEGGIFEPKRGREIPVSSVNLPGYQLVAAPLDEMELVSVLTQRSERDIEHRRVERAKQLPGAVVEQVRPTAARNVDHVKRMSLDRVLAPKGGFGAAIVGLAYGDERGKEVAHTRVLSVTDLAITGKLSRFGSVVWVTRLSTGTPVPGAQVSVATQAKGIAYTTMTDQSGMAVIAPDRFDPVAADGQADRLAVLLARVGTDWAFREVSDMLSPYGYAFSADPSGRLDPMGMVFTDRGVYRAGETVRARVIFRKPTPKGTETPAGREVVIEAYDGQGDKFFSRKERLDAFGAVAADVAIPAAAHLGGAYVRAELVDRSAPQQDGDSSRGATASFQLAAYKAAEFKVAVEPDRTSYVRGDRAAFVVRGDYLFGAPMSGGKVRATVTRGHGSFTPPGAEELVLDDEAYAADLVETAPRAGEVSSARGPLDAKGTLASSAKLELPRQRGTEVVTFEADVEDVSRQTLSGRSSVIVHPAEFYVAMKPPQELFVAKGQTLRPEIAAIEPGGRRRAGVAVHVDLVRRTWQTAFQASGESGGHYESRAVDKVLASCDLTTGAGFEGCPLPVSEAGYFLLRATSKDPRGNPVAASTGLYALGDAASLGWMMGDATRLDLVTDKKSYEVGDVARVLVKSPFPGAEALITVERAGLYRQERQVLVGATPTIRVPITDDMRPNAYVSVHLVRGRTKAAPATGQDVGAPAFRLGYAELRVNPEARRLGVKVVPAKREARPGEPLDLDVVVTDRAGKPAKAEVTFYAVDEGVLMLTGYKTPDPIPVFTAPRPLAVFALESRADLARTFLSGRQGPGADKGAAGGGGGGLRADFRATAHFEPSLVTGSDGKAHVRFKLPDSVTTYRLMAVVAAEDDRFGFGESQLVTSRPLMMRPALPRFLRAGDKLEAGVVLSSKGLADAQVDVSIAAQGVEVVGDARRSVKLPAGGTVEVRWPLAAHAVGKASFAFRASGGGETDGVQVTREVQAPLSPEAVALYGETREAVAEKLGDLRSARADVGQLDVRLAKTALVGLGGGVEQLLEYPYGCTEQLASRLIPLVPLRALASELALSLPANVDKAIDDAVAKILQNQHAGGGFGYWPDSPEPDLWVSAYALFSLEQAKRAGRHVPSDALDRGVRYLHAQLVKPERERWLGLASKAFIADVLATMGKGDPGYTGRLYDQREKLPLFARALLAHAMAELKMDPKSIGELSRDFENHLRLTPSGATVAENLGDDYAPLLDSEARTTAMVLRALVASQKGHPLSARLARGLLGARERGRWRSTQEAAWALLSLADYRRVEEPKAADFDAVVFMGERQLTRAEMHDKGPLERSLSLPMSELLKPGLAGQSLAFQVQGQGKLFYEVRLRYAKKDLPTEALDRGFFVKKVVRAVPPEQLQEAMATLPKASAARVGPGELVLVDVIVVSSSPREHVVVDDPLPAGLEAVQAGFETTSRAAALLEPGGAADEADDEAASDDARAAGRATNVTYYHREIRDDRVLTFVPHMPAGMAHYRYLARATTLGQFVVPPTRAECMYEPALFGRTAASTLEVKAQ